MCRYLSVVKNVQNWSNNVELEEFENYRGVCWKEKAAITN